MKKEDIAIFFGIMFALFSGILTILVTATTISEIGFENSWMIATPIGIVVATIVLPLWTIAWLIRQDI